MYLMKHIILVITLLLLSVLAHGDEHDKDSQSTSSYLSRAFINKVTTFKDAVTGESAEAEDEAEVKAQGLPQPQVKRQAQAQVKPQKPIKREKTVRERTFDAAIETIYPLTPGQVQDLIEFKELDDEAIYSERIPRLVSESRKLIIEPGSEVPKLSLVPGYISSIIFVDANGEPWPITSFTPRSTSLFRFEKLEGLEPGNMLTLQAMRKIANGSIAITLKDKDVPIVIQLGTPRSGDAYNSDSVIAYHIQSMGPNYSATIKGEQPLSPLHNDMLAFLNNTPPQAAIAVTLQPELPNTKIWRFGDNFYLRTKHSPRWPAWSPQIARGSSGIRVYKMLPTHSLILSVNGKTINYKTEY